MMNKDEIYKSLLYSKVGVVLHELRAQKKI